MPTKKDDDKSKAAPAQDADVQDEQQDEAAPSYGPSGRSPERAAAQAGYQGGLVTGDPKPPGREDPTMPRELLNPAGAPLMPHPGVSMPENTDPPEMSTDEQMDEFAPQDRGEVDEGRDAGEDDPKAKPKAKAEKAPLNANDIKTGQVINAPRS